VEWKKRKGRILSGDKLATLAGSAILERYTCQELEGRNAVFDHPKSCQQTKRRERRLTV
jgi:hypothetical protein